MAMAELKPLTGQEAVDELIEHFLGVRWYVVDPLSTAQVNAIAVDEIKKKYPNEPKRKWWNRRAGDKDGS